MAKQSVLRVFEVYKSNRSQQWSWRARSFKNKKITFTGESHPTEAKAIRAIQQELTALGATNRVRIDVISGDNQREIPVDTMAPLSFPSVPPLAVLGKALDAMEAKAAAKKSDLRAAPKAVKKIVKKAAKRPLPF